MRTSFWIWVWAVCLAGLVGTGLACDDERPMNIVLVLVDDLGWQDTAVPMLAEPTAQNGLWRTPNVQRLAASGVRFSNGYASAPVCTPTRTSILTGMTPARTGITYWTLHEGTDTSRVHEGLAPPAWRVNGLQPGEHALLPELLRRAGYRTIHAGKAHFGAVGTPGADPERLGFEVNIAGHAAGAPASYWGEDHYSQAGKRGEDHEENPSVWDVPGLDKFHGSATYLTEALASEASGEIRRAAADGVPFFLSFAPYAVHTPLMANERYAAGYPGLDAQETKYATMIESVDAAVGTLVTALQETGQLDRTVIVFTGDNGGLSAHARGLAPDGQTRHTHNAPARSGKGSGYEGGTRVPWIVAWPGVTDAPGRAGTLDATPVVSHDLFPTFLGIAGVPIPNAAAGGEPIDGVDLAGAIAGLVAGRGHDLGERVLGWHQPHQWGASGPGIEPFTSVRRGRWKLLFFHADERYELYDLSADPGESVDLAATTPAALAEMRAVLVRWVERTGAQPSVRKPTGEPVLPTAGD
ncbi:MAG: arylsulfatase A-like enzyme [Phycisphaerales bacterium]|jgi:arylsulfatase A-like enzyme